MTAEFKSRKQLTLHWEADDAAWRRMPQERQSLCQELLAEMLRTVAVADENERSESDES
jgi:hypothetical protein